MRYPGFKAKAVTLSYDDGVTEDQKFIEIINKGGLKCTFNVNSNRFHDKPYTYDPDKTGQYFTKDDAKSLYTNSGHEVAAHFLDHCYPNELTPLMTTTQIYEDRKNLEEMFGTEVRGMAYPYGQFDDTAVEIAKNCGIVYSRTTKSSYGFNLPKDWLRLQPTCHHISSHLKELTDEFINCTVNNAPILFYLWGHTYEFARNNNWDVIEDFTKAVGNRDDIWYATNIEIYDYVSAFKSLRFTIACDKVFNPTCYDIYFKVSGNNIVVHPGETVAL